MPDVGTDKLFNKTKLITKHVLRKTTYMLGISILPGYWYTHSNGFLYGIL